MKRSLLFFLIPILLLIVLEVLSVYFIMPFPGSQLGLTEAETGQAALGRVELAYWLHKNISWLRIVGLLLLAYPAFLIIMKPRRVWHRYVAGGLVLLYGVVLYEVNREMMADQMFKQPIQKRVVPMSENKIPLNKLVVGFEAMGQATAYPLQLIGYHHQVRDTVGGQPIMVTYCTVCRTGRVFSPFIKGEADEFRLVGMDHFNAMFEDKRTGSWWRQATGEAIVGPLKGKSLSELTGRQMTLGEWAAEHPNTRVLQADPAFAEEFENMKKYDRGLSKGKLTRRDSASWKPKSWVIGVEKVGFSKAYDWNKLQTKRILNDVVGNEPLVLTMAPDSVSFGVWSRRVGVQTLNFQYANRQLTDQETKSVWTWRGHCVAGPLLGKRLAAIPKAHQEFWHSWRTFHPDTRRDDAP
ncbi:DUF3179 domain-containing protein [Spirosoma sp. KCTC 42546]|uniref:DUF3179 domain-containing (seleno)protein n=1 Tax=Spirosoma sp. KCTC 42546 TaxID=2520506 RepID=UPI00115B8E7A|nr:DUF3179 domain-containing (seleno)protein [Spirosoma sp. KCTC 42546]QDK78194.1 DUF3179 domain-containing protein [Spirosoma sp. KCTC 42546]